MCDTLLYTAIDLLFTDVDIAPLTMYAVFVVVVVVVVDDACIHTSRGVYLCDLLLGDSVDVRVLYPAHIA